MAQPQAWFEDRTRLLEAAAELDTVGRDTVRLADLLLARAIADRLGLGGTLTQASLRSSLSELALMPLPRFSRSKRLQEEAVDAAHSCASHAVDRDLFHAWSESSQSSDPSRKGRGAFSTPPALSKALASVALRNAIATLGRPPVALDPSAGHGALLLAVLDALLASGTPAEDAAACLHGVELDPHARELCCLFLWLKLNRRDIPLGEIASRVVLGNALTARWSAEANPLPPGGVETAVATQFDWETTFPAAFAEGGFDLVVANPPWESLRHCGPAESDEWQERERTRARLSTESDSGRGLPPLYSAQGRGDRNLYKGFAELFPHLLCGGGRLVALLPGAFSSDLGMQSIRQLYLERMKIERWTGFENLAGYFPIDSRYKFGVLVAERSEAGTSSFQVKFMAKGGAEAAEEAGHLDLTRGMIAKIGGSSRMFPEVSDREEMAILERACDRGTPFFDPQGSFGAVGYRRELDLTLDRKAGRFIHLEEGLERGFRPRRDGRWSDGEETLVPLIEGRMVTAWDFFEKSWISGRGRSARWEVNASGLGKCQPQFLAAPLESPECRLAICDVTSSTNTRTMRATWVPSWPCGNTAPVLSAVDPSHTLALLAVLNSMTFDWVLRRLAAGLHLNRFYLEAMPLPRVTDAEAAALAGFAASSMLATGRCKSLAAADRAGLEAAAPASPPSAGRIEAVVATGYGLHAGHLRRIMDSSTNDRKGLWRFFAANPEAVETAREGIDLLAAA